MTNDSICVFNYRRLSIRPSAVLSSTKSTAGGGSSKTSAVKNFEGVSAPATPSGGEKRNVGGKVFEGSAIFPWMIFQLFKQGRAHKISTR